MAEAPPQAHLTSPKPAEVGTDFESSLYDELAVSRNGKQRCRFVDEYVITSVASEAVTAAGYKTRNPRQKGWELMRTYAGQSSDITPAQLQDYVSLVESGELKPKLGPNFPFEKLRDAHTTMDENMASGKIVMEVV